MRDLFAHVWHKMNPVEPTPMYLVKFMASIIGVIGLALVIGLAAGA